MREFGNSFVKWLMFDNNLRRFLISLKIKKSDSDPNISQEDSARLSYSGNSIPLVTDSALRYVNRLESIFDGAGWAYNLAYPLTLLALMARDLHAYHSQPENRYGNSVGDIFAGTSPNQNTWSAHFGKSELYLPSTLYWLPTLLMAVVLPALTSSFELYRRRDFINAQALNRDQYVRLAAASAGSMNGDCYYRDELPERAFSDWAEFNALWNDQIDLQVLADFVELLGEASSATSFYKRYKRSHILANLAAFDERDYQLRLAERGSLNDQDILPVSQTIHSSMQSQATYGSALNDDAEVQSQLTIRRKALETLANIAAEESAYSYANYLLWRMGKGLSGKGFSPLFLLPVLWKLWQYYAKIRFFELVIIKSKGLAEFNNQKKSCESKNKQWLYMPQMGRYECNVCGDWDFVTYQAAASAQACLDALLSKNRGAEFLLASLPRIFQHATNLTRLDLSQQNLAQWSVAQFGEFLIGFSQAGVNNLNLLNISALAQGPYLANSDQLAILARFINSTQIRAIDLNSQQLSLNGVAPILAALRNSSVEWLDLSANNLDDRSAPIFTQIVESSPLRFLGLANNQLSDVSLEYLQNVTQATELQNLSISNNQFTDAGAANFISSMSFELIALDFSYNQLGLRTASAIGKYSQNHRLNSFICAVCQFDDSSLLNMTSSLNAPYLDLSGNIFGDEAAAEFFSGLGQTRIQFLGWNNIPLSSAVTEALGQALPNTQLRGLNLQNTGLSAVTLNSLLAYANVSALQFLDISYNSFDNANSQILSQVWRYPTSLVSVRVKSCGISDASAAEFIRAAAGSSLQQLDISENNLGANFASALAGVLPQLELVDLDMSLNPITDEALMNLAPSLPGSDLKTLGLGSVDVGDFSCLFLGRELISPVPHAQKLSELNTDRDQDHAVGQAQATTDLLSLKLAGNSLSAGAQTLFCRVQAVTGLESSALGLGDMNWRSCAGSSEFANASMAMSFSAVTAALSERADLGKMAVMAVMQFILFYNLYRMLIKPAYQYCFNAKAFGRR